MRRILGNYLDCAPAEVSLSEGHKGKPCIDAGPENAWLQFNLAHCEDKAILAVGSGFPVGVDIERVRSVTRQGKLVEHVFSDAEIAAFSSRPAKEQPRAFFRAWVCKEAYLKCLGVGLSKPLRKVEVQISEDAAPRIALHDISRTAPSCDLMEFTVFEDHVGALVTPRRQVNLLWKCDRDLTGHTR